VENYKKKIVNNCHNDIKCLKINNTISSNPQEIANTFNDYFLTVADTVIGNIKKGDNDSRQRGSFQLFVYQLQ
jgi:hypothetical protein